MELIDFNISKLAFLFLAYAIISGGYVTQVLPCEIKHILKNNIYSKHVIGIILIFTFIMMEGGWDFDIKEQNKAPNDWSRGNTLHSLVFAVIGYCIFILTSKMKWQYNVFLYSLLFTIYVVNTYRNYISDRDRLSEKLNKLILNAEIVGLVIALLVLVYGNINYFFYEKKSYKKSFSMKKFVLGTAKCRNE